MKKIIAVLLLFVSLQVDAQKPIASAFKVVPLGVKGGIDETNLSAYMVAPAGTKDYICFDAGTLHAGINKAITNKTFKGVTTSNVLRQYIKAYLISHAHLDHVSGLIINSPDDSTKPVYALQSVMQMMENNYFNGEAWVNFGDEGKGFKIGKYHFKTLQPAVPTAVDNTSMEVTAFPLSHVNPYESTAFLVKSKDAYVLYLGDTGSDEIEKSDKLKLLWQQVAPLVVAKQLKGIFIEVSFSDDQPKTQLFGHLTPSLLMKEMSVLNELTGNLIKGLPIVVTHVKPPASNEAKLHAQLLQQNKLGLKLIFPEQGKAFML